MDRRAFVRQAGTAGAVVAASSFWSLNATAVPVTVGGGWRKFAGNPVLGGQYGVCFDICVLHDGEKFRMWLSWRPRKSVAVSESADGIHWSEPQVVLAPNPSSGWEDEINRPVVVRRGATYHMWYTGQTWRPTLPSEGRTVGRSAIGYAVSSDGLHWVRKSAEPVLSPQATWEKVALMCPHVLWSEKDKTFRMWYSGGDQYEPNAVGYATSEDGIHWIKNGNNPVFRPDPRYEWEQQRVAGVQIIEQDGWFYALYIGYRDIDHAQIGVARSRDGLTRWERCPDNPIIRSVGNGFDADACYKPYAVFAGGKWMLWYNGRNMHLEQIGLATRDGYSLGFKE